MGYQPQLIGQLNPTQLIGVPTQLIQAQNTNQLIGTPQTTNTYTNSMVTSNVSNSPNIPITNSIQPQTIQSNNYQPQIQNHNNQIQQQQQHQQINNTLQQQQQQPINNHSHRDRYNSSYNSRILENHFKPNPSTGRYEIHGDWYLKKILGSGAYGEVHQAIEKFAIKLDSRNNQEIEREIDYLKKLNGTSNHIPQIIEYGRYSGVSYFVLTLLGRSLSDLKKKRIPQKFSLS